MGADVDVGGGAAVGSTASVPHDAASSKAVRINAVPPGVFNIWCAASSRGS